MFALFICCSRYVTSNFYYFSFSIYINDVFSKRIKLFINFILITIACINESIMDIFIHIIIFDSLSSLNKKLFWNIYFIAENNGIEITTMAIIRREGERERDLVLNYVSISFNFRQWPCYQLYRSFAHFVQSRKISVLIMFGVCVCVCFFLIYFRCIYTFLKGNFVTSIKKNGVFVFIIWCHDILFFDWSKTDMVDSWEF